MKKLFLICSLIITTTTTSTNAFAHGEDKYGPNKGYIRMPGSFHTELVLQKDGSYFIYLLDLQNKNPAVKDSSVEMKIISSDIKNLTCMPMSDFFHCQGEKLNLDKGKISLKAKRLGVEAREAIYELPLSLKKIEKLNSSMEGHDMKNMK
ncbi:MAG: hypothetical protein H7281_10970 [Bacteriovorax sp.]|nr:hypothetical protein [Bacteriovorax sp.]